MVRAAKTSTEKVSSSTTTPVVSTTAPAKTATKKAVKSETVVASTTAPVVAASTEQVEVPPPVDASTLLPIKMNEFNAKLQQLVSLFSTVKNDFKTLEKAVTREMKNAQKLTSKKRRNNGNRKPSGFIKPTRISDELAAFLGKNIGTEMARTEVSRKLTLISKPMVFMIRVMAEKSILMPNLLNFLKSTPKMNLLISISKDS
jgi:hypothetical protein